MYFIIIHKIIFYVYCANLKYFIILQKKWPKGTKMDFSYV
jgi:hypothetical protein